MSPARPPVGANSLSEGQGRRPKGARVSAKGGLREAGIEARLPPSGRPGSRDELEPDPDPEAAA